MRRSDINILVIEDNQVFAQQVVAALKEAKFNAKSVYNPAKALTELRVDNYHLLVVDCMLPQSNGIQLVQQIQEEYGKEKYKVVYISGVFKDQNFANDAIYKTGALDFLFKPFEMEELIKVVNAAFVDDVGEVISDFYSFMSEPNSSAQEAIDAFNETKSISGLEIPYALAFAMNSKVTGDINVVSSNGETSTVCLHEGRIFQVKSSDTESYFGAILIGNGFTTPEEVTRGLASQNERPIGERLVELNSLSPHAIRLAQIEQMSIRLSKLIKNESLTIEFTEQNYDPPEIYLETEMAHNSFNDWVASKIKKQWIQIHMQKWSDHHLIRSENYKKITSEKSLALVNLVPNFDEDLSKATPLYELFEKYKTHNFALQGLYFLILTNAIKISPDRQSQPDFSASLERVKRTLESIEGKNYYEMLGVGEQDPPFKIEASFYNFAKSLHPDKLGKDAPDELVELSTDLFQILSQAKDTLLNRQERQKYDFELKNGKADQILQSDALFERGLIDLENNQYDQAARNFKQVLELNTYNDDFHIYYSWALLKRGCYPTEKKLLVELVTNSLMQVPQEQRHNAKYFYVKGLLHKLEGQHERALVAFKNATHLDDSFKAAHIEWSNLQKKIQAAQPKGFFDKLFGKKSG